MMSISVEAAEARDSLSDDKELVNTYEVIVIFLMYWLLLGTKFKYYIWVHFFIYLFFFFNTYQKKKKKLHS